MLASCHMTECSFQGREQVDHEPVAAQQLEIRGAKSRPKASHGGAVSQAAAWGWAWHCGGGIVLWGLSCSEAVLQQKKSPLVALKGTFFATPSQEVPSESGKRGPHR